VPGLCPCFTRIIFGRSFIASAPGRYGYTERFIDPQGEINHRRSKGLYMLSSAQVLAEQGAVKDKDAILRELRKAQGYIEFGPGKKFEISRNIEGGRHS
jgi:hypothetical protein